VAVGWPAFAAAALGVVVLAAGYLAKLGQRTPLEWFALATLVLATAAVMGYSAFFYHYPDFPAPWLAIAAGAAVGSLACLIQGTAPSAKLARRIVGAAIAVVILGVAAIEARELSPIQMPANPNVSALVPAGSCLVADQISFAIATNRFEAPGAGCPDLVDSLAATLALSGGVSPEGGAGQSARVVAGWEAIFWPAKYVWLSAGAKDRLPLTTGLQSWFAGHFRLVESFPGYGGSKLYVRR
jgi:hypothetical protein